MPLGPDEERLLREVSCLYVEGDRRRIVLGRVTAWTDPDYADKVCATVCAVLDQWEIRVDNDGDAEASWVGPTEETPGIGDWDALGETGRMLAFLDGQFGPGERPLLATLGMTEGGPTWEVCLAPLRLGHLHMPYMAPPALESL